MRDARRTTLRATALGAALIGLTGATAGAQTASPPPTIEACYVPLSGTIYRINTTQSPAPLAPSACLSGGHVRFTWNQQGVQGPAGPKGDAGAAGPQGMPGAPGISGYQLIVKREEFGPTMNQKNFYAIQVNCPSGKRIIGGGAYSDWHVAVSAPNADHMGLTPLPGVPDYWKAKFEIPSDWAGQTSARIFTFAAYAICANVS